MLSLPAARRLGAALALCFLSGLAGGAPDKSDRSAAELMDVVMWNREPIGGAFRLTDQAGKVRRDTDFRGRLMLVYFGFTFCPDICPTDLQQIAMALKALGPAASEVAPLFITLDPERDTVKLLAQYVPAFDARITGLTGDAAAIHHVARAYRVYHAKVANNGASRYTIDHSSFIYLMGRDGKYLGFIPPSTSADRIAAALRAHLDARPVK
jgi:cytochrome oxidase Cu insertion factor (SCO1/SenC/PrrC family)